MTANVWTKHRLDSVPMVVCGGGGRGEAGLVCSADGRGGLCSGRCNFLCCCHQSHAAAAVSNVITRFGCIPLSLLPACAAACTCCDSTGASECGVTVPCTVQCPFPPSCASSCALAFSQHTREHTHINRNSSLTHFTITSFSRTRSVGTCSVRASP